MTASVIPLIVAHPHPSEAVPQPPAPPTVAAAVRRLAQLLTLFFCLFLVVRTVFVEPFGVPTGSMAPALYGNHRETVCPRCGCPVCVNEKESKHVADSTPCPNCGLASVPLSGASDGVYGDRLMVDKTAFLARGPRRWEVAVFNCPVDGRKLYVKRVVGLPGEAVLVRDGDVYADGELRRKTLAEFNDCRVPVFLMDHPPRPTGWADRWVVEPVAASPRLPPAAPDAPLPDVAAVVQDTALVLDAAADPAATLALTYRHRSLDKGKDEPVDDRLGYNGEPGSTRPVHDFAVECVVEVTAANGTPASLALRLGDGLDTVRADIPVGDADAPLVLAADGGNPTRSTTGVRLKAGKTYRLEFAFVDRRASLAVDGQELLPAIDLDAPKPNARSGVVRPLQLGVRGCAVTVRHLTLYRDVHYRSDGAGNVNAVKEPLPLGADEFFVLGDNSTDSYDARGWAVPGVPRGDFVGKPFLIHQPLRVGRVPLLGRVSTVDWDRFRLIH